MRASKSVTTQFAVGLAAASCFVGIAAAQQRVDLGGAPDRGPVYAEFLVNGGGRGFAGFATLYNGHPVIFFDIVWINRLGGTDSPEFRFLRAHEYGHHRRHHAMQQMQAPPVMLGLLGYQSEIDADCWAVRTLRKFGDDEAVQAAFRLYAQTVPPQDSQGRPGATKRHAEMQRCLAAKVN